MKLDAARQIIDDMEADLKTLRAGLTVIGTDNDEKIELLHRWIVAARFLKFESQLVIDTKKELGLS